MTLLKGSAFFIERNDMGLVQVRGADARDFLQRITSQDLRHINPGEALPNCLLQPNGLIKVFFYLLWSDDGAFLFCEKSASAKLSVELENLHFAEKLEIKNLTSDFVFITVLSPKGDSRFEGIIKSEFLNILEILKLDVGEMQSHTMKLSHEEKDRVLSLLLKYDFIKEQTEFLRLLNYEASLLDFNEEMYSKYLAVELPLENAISRNKGCYPGQEVVERVASSGILGKKLVGLCFPKKVAGTFSPEKVPATFFGKILSLAFIPWSQQMLGLAMLRKPFYQAGEMIEVDFEGEKYIAKVYELPHSFKREQST
jgi:folate-binding protein YgfZ